MAEDSVNFTVKTEEPKYPWINWFVEKIKDTIGGK